jgi:hypothetical protein
MMDAARFELATPESRAECSLVRIRADDGQLRSERAVLAVDRQIVSNRRFQASTAWVYKSTSSGG